MEAREQDLFADIDSRAEENAPIVDAAVPAVASDTSGSSAGVVEADSGQGDVLKANAMSVGETIEVAVRDDSSVGEINTESTDTAPFETEPDYIVYEAEPISDEVGPVEYVDEVVVYEAMPVDEIAGNDTYEAESVQDKPAESAATLESEMKGSLGSLFRTFFRIGIVTFGGGYAMIPMIESEVVDKRQWVEKAQFLDLIAIAQTCPGVFAINISTFIGYRLRRTPGALLAALGAALPSFLIILAIAMVFRQFQDIPWVAACFKGIRPAVVALIAVPTFNLAKSAQINLSTCWIPIVGAFLICLFHVNPIFVILGAAFLGYLYGMFLNN